MTRPARVILLAMRPLLAAALLCLLSPPVAAAPFPHEAWGRVLAKFVDDRGFVDYAALSRDRSELDSYLARIAREGPRTAPAAFPGRDDRLAYYLNAYNALVFSGVLARGPETESVWRGGLVSGYSFFVGTKVRLDGEETNLKRLEDDVVRKEFADPRVHAALNCASRGCPRLPREAFDPSRLDAQLDAAMAEFVSDERNVAVDPARRAVTLSKIFDWFEKDFLASERAHENGSPRLLDYVNRYRKEKVDRTFAVRFAPYDKRINAR